MRIAAVMVAALALLLSVPGDPVRSGAEITLSGEYAWIHMSHKDDLHAVFSPMGDAAWNVEFRFVWDDELHAYRGTARGSLTDGPLHGTIVTDDPDLPRTFFFDGTFENGHFTGTHTALQLNGGRKPTGTLSLSPP